jgi:glycosyltransferase involved in cell wall biosynthesis
VILSVLVASVVDRAAKLSGLLANFEKQIEGRKDVEVLVMTDMRGMTIGEKRNCLVALAQGEYVAFVDDDDAVAPDYISAIVAKLVRESPDVLCFQVLVTGYGKQSRVCRYHPSFENANLFNEYRRKPNHLMVWRRSIASRVRYPHIRYGEDTLWADAATPLAQKVSVIDRQLYTYKYSHQDNAGRT